MAQRSIPNYRSHQRKGFSASGIVRISYIVLILTGAASAVLYILST